MAVSAETLLGRQVVALAQQAEDHRKLFMEFQTLLGMVRQIKEGTMSIDQVTVTADGCSWGPAKDTANETPEADSPSTG